MMHVVVGTDTYGRVKAVDKTAVVTMFSMVQMLPVGPVKSYYVWGPSTSEVTGVPFFASVRNIKLRGVPLARQDLTSIAFAYVRAALAALVLVGFIGTFTGLIFSSNGKQMDEFALTVTRLAEACLVTGVAGAVLTYLVPTTSRRKRAIRKYCGEMLGVSIDPGRVVPEVAGAVREMLQQPDGTNQGGVIRPRSEYVRELILTRCEAATGGDSNYEALTDELLDQLRHLDRVAPSPPTAAEPRGAADGGGI